MGNCVAKKAMIVQNGKYKERIREAIEPSEKKSGAANCNREKQRNSSKSGTGMSAEFHVLSPAVPTRDTYFVRYCKHHMDGTWAVVDISLHNSRFSSVLTCPRRPSGCLIQEMPNGYSKVTWIELVDVDDRIVHNLYKPLVSSGLAFGAKRWLFAPEDLA
ncbi:hypothetical protein Vadar_029596 [Vaccinium darrowii]|uniref:Uncharacterized protein n=1 Tax=Vaccinium darrowii TaxID=229202 RepID=A0ACB7XU02_9ERIC|nr:hypothetical protein Vadar_029596 [Vaccinium darrowii]